MANFSTGGLFFHSFGAYLVALEQQFGWSKTLLSGAFSLARIEGGLLGPITGILIDKFGPRWVMGIGFFLFGLGFVLASRITSPLEFYIAFIFVAVGSSFGGFLVSITTINNWFRRRRASAMGIAGVGMGVGGVFVPVVVWALSTFGWRTTVLGLGIIIWALGLPMSRLLRRRPEEYGLLPDGQPSDDGEGAALGESPVPQPATAEDFTARQALRTRAFWFLAIGHTAAIFVVSAMTVHQIAFMEQDLGFSRIAAANVVMVLTICMIFGQLSVGLVGDRVDKRLVMTGAMLAHAVGLLLLVTASSLGQAMAYAAIHGLAWGSRGIIINAIRGDYFGRRAFGTISGYNNLITSTGHVVGPLMAAVIADRLGSYDLAFYILAASVAASSLLFLTLKRPTLPVSAASLTASPS